MVVVVVVTHVIVAVGRTEVVLLGWSAACLLLPHMHCSCLDVFSRERWTLDVACVDKRRSTPLPWYANKRLDPDFLCVPSGSGGNVWACDLHD